MRDGLDRARRPHGRLEAVPRPRLHARPRHRPLDRDDDDRVPAGRRGDRGRAARGHGRLDAPARDHADERTCLYMQDTWLVTDAGGRAVLQVPLKIFDGTESRPEACSRVGTVSANEARPLPRRAAAVARGRLRRPRGGARLPDGLVPGDHLRRRVRAGDATAVRTSRLGLGTGVVGIWSRSAATMALQAATLNELSHGRLQLGIGLQARGYVEGWHGAAIRAAGARDARVHGDPPPGSSPARRSATRARSSRSGTSSSRCSRPSGRCASTWPRSGRRCSGSPASWPTACSATAGRSSYLRDVVLPNLRAGAERAGRSLDEIDVACGFPALVTRDESGLELVRGQVMMFATAGGSSPEYARSFAAAGFGDEVREIVERVQAADVDGALAVDHGRDGRRDDDGRLGRPRARPHRGATERGPDHGRAEPVGARHAGSRSTRATFRTRPSPGSPSSRSRRSSASSTTRSSCSADDRSPG